MLDVIAKAIASKRNIASPIRTTSLMVALSLDIVLMVRDSRLDYIDCWYLRTMQNLELFSKFQIQIINFERQD